MKHIIFLDQRLNVRNCVYKPEGKDGEIFKMFNEKRLMKRVTSALICCKDS